jgi:hypothetical protein
VTDAAWSPDGSRIAFIDGDGNVATARPDGSGLIVLTGPANGAVRSRPAWSRAVIFYGEKKADGTSALKAVSITGCGNDGAPDKGREWGMDTGEGTSYVDAAPSAAQTERPVRVAFQHDEPSGSQIWINDTNQRAPFTGKIVDGAEPALRADGVKLAYVGRDGQVYLRDAKQDAVSLQITFGADHPNHLTWTPDGQHVAYATPAGIESVGISPGNGTNPASKLSTARGVPTFLASTKDTVVRITGADPIALAIAASQARWPSRTQYFMTQSTVPAYGLVLVTPDQVTKLPSNASGSALLLTAGDTLDPRTMAELQRVYGTITPLSGGAPPAKLYGDAISPAVANALTSMKFEVTRGPAPTSGPGGGGDGACGPEQDRSYIGQRLIVVDASSATDNAIASWLASAFYAPIVRVDGKAALTDQLKAYLAQGSPAIGAVYLVDSGAKIGADLEKAIGTLVSGPAGYDTATNPTVPAFAG